MEPFVTIAEFALPTDVAVARGLLESEGIECRLQDELTVQVYNLYSNAIGGVKLQVRADEAGRAKALLIEGGFIHADQEESGLFWQKLDQWTRRVPLLGKVDLLIARAFIAVCILLVLIVAPIWWATRPSFVDRLVESSWCLEEVVHNGRPVDPDFEGVYVHIGCPSRISFNRNGQMSVRGFGMAYGEGTWFLHNGNLQLHGPDVTDAIFHGTFKVTLGPQFLELRSTHTTIFCTKDSFFF